MLRVEKLTYTVKGRKLLKDVSFQLRKGEVLALLGANGAGKSTLMRLLSRELKADSGIVQLFGKTLDQYDGRELSKCRAMLNQQNHLSLAFSVREIVMMGRYPHFKSQPTAYDQQIVEEVMQICGIGMFADRVYLSLSGGEQQRVQLARVLTQIWDNPESLLLLDEPISALDLYYQQKVLAIAKAMSRKGFMVVVVLHDVNFAASYADRILMLKNGRKLFDGTPVEVLNKKDIYTVFSVDTEVAINVQTLKPNIQLQEMVLDGSLFTSTLRNKGNISLSEKINRILTGDTCLSDRELTRILRVSDMELAIHDQRNVIGYLSSDFKEIVRDIDRLGKCRHRVGNIGCQFMKYTQFDEWAENVHTFANAGDTRLLLDIAAWHTGLSVVSDLTHDLRFYDATGGEVYAVSLESDSAMLAEYKALCDRFGVSARQTSSANISRRNSTSSSDALCVTADDNCPVNEWADSLYAVGSQRRRYLQQLLPKRAQRLELPYLKQVLNQSVRNGDKLTFVVPSKGAQLQYTGKLSHLIDQGNRYIAKVADTELTLFLDDIDELWSTTTQGRLGKVRTLELFDVSENPVLQIMIRDEGRFK
jgi:ABC-type hemin transport system ATPase subunit/putative heme degradation protein